MKRHRKEESPDSLSGVRRRHGQHGSGPHLGWGELNRCIKEVRQRTERFVEDI